jgi:hypothetical protein
VSRFEGEYSAFKVVRQLGTGGFDIVTMYLLTWHRPFYETENVDLICMWL